MMIFLAGGFVSYLNLNQEEFPDIDFGVVQGERRLPRRNAR